MHGRYPDTRISDAAESDAPSHVGLFDDGFDEPYFEDDDQHLEPKYPTRQRRDLSGSNNGRLILLVAAVAVVAAIAIFFTGGDADDSIAISSDTQTVSFAPVTAAPIAPEVGSTEQSEAASVELDGCMLNVIEVKSGDQGESVECVQKGLYAAGYYDGEINGLFDTATLTAIEFLQAERGLYVDGIVGARTAESLGIWPGAESFVIKTPPPSPGAMDSMGFPLSAVATTGDDAPEMPANSGQGTGKRIVYDRAGQRVWAVDSDEHVVRSYLVTGSQYRNEVPGIHQVYSRSEMTTAWNGAADLPLMVRWLDTERGAIGFHAIPTKRSTGELYQTVDELGQKMSGGCQRQTMKDARFMWEFAPVGTNVYVT